MNQETKICQNCKRDFVIEPEDFLFYEKISVPAPTFCPECRAQRRLTWRNERTLYKRTDAIGTDIISIFASDSPFTVYERGYWWSDKWDPLEFGLRVDFSKSFFSQFRTLLEKVPLASLFANNIQNSDYTNHVAHMNRCYLTYASWECEDVLYGEKIIKSKSILDAYLTDKSAYCYETIDCSESNRLYYGRDCHQCIDSAFLFDCRNCQNCFGCVGLRNKQFHIFNKPYTKEEYQKIIREGEYDFGSYKNVEKIADEFGEFKNQYPHKFAFMIKAVDVIGDHCQNVKNCYYCFDLSGVVENSKYIVLGGLGMTDSYDGYGAGAGCDMLYEGIDTGVGGSKERFSIVVYGCRETNYCFNCENSSNLFGCIGLRNKQYCVLNKQYTKEEYEALVPKIIEHMNTMPYTDAQGRTYKYGEFFPPELSPFAYNETIAQEYFPLTKESALEQGYRWKEPEEKQHTPTISWRDLPDNIKDVQDSILDEAILCSAWDEDAKKAQEHNCTKVFRIIPQELAFYRKMNLPLPRFCPNSRHFHRIQQRNPLRLWHRKCMCQGAQTYAESDTDVSAQTHADDTQNNAEIGLRESAFGQRESALPYINTANHFHGTDYCPNEFETSYAPERPEIVYCEKCYQAEVV